MLIPHTTSIKPFQLARLNQPSHDREARHIIALIRSAARCQHSINDETPLMLCDVLQQTF